MRLFLYDRYIKMIKTELTYGITRIIMFFFSFIMLSSMIIQFIENVYRYNVGRDSNHAHSDGVVEAYDLMMSFDFFDAFYFMMTTVSVVGYGSYIYSLEGRIACILIILIIVVTIPGSASDLVTLLNSKSKFALA